MINRTNKNKKKNLESLELYRQSASIGSKILEIDISFFFPPRVIVSPSREAQLAHALWRVVGR